MIFALFFAAACVFHFLEADGFAQMLPDFVPLRLPMIYATGVLELVLGVLLLIPRTMRLTGTLIAIYLVLVFPANIYAAIKEIPAPGFNNTPPSALWIRLIFQPLLIWWVLWCSRGRGTEQ
ncbi:DoxX family protein [Paenibacillus dokdonensis]|uniref:DoxX family protein n=1 Tax=Paenibacillus dokdonensis TaxID=2567944 RepID=UPI0010A81284|nr:hypothetical protein [Paenibacillus dokdonensis]